jgi:hypothetical protein
MPLRLRHLMPLGLGARSLQRVLAAGTTLRLEWEDDIDLLLEWEDDIDLLDRQQRLRLPLATGLSAGSPPAGLAAVPLAQGLGRIARRWLRRSPRVLLQLLSHLMDRSLQLLDNSLQTLDGLPQCSYSRFQRSDVGLGRRAGRAPTPLAIRGSRCA